jgi:DNA-binding response OmpR family regulator
VTAPRVLVIEDDKDIALGLRIVLERAGFQAALAADGRDGLRVFHSVRPDLVILDIGLPEMDGWTVLERIRDLSDVPVLMPTEFRLLAALVRHQGQVLSPDTLLDLAWSDPFGIGPERVKYAIMRLRRKLGAQEETADSPIEAVRGFGYRYRASPGRPPQDRFPRPEDSAPRRYGPLLPATRPHPASHAAATAGRHGETREPNPCR